MKVYCLLLFCLLEGVTSCKLQKSQPIKGGNNNCSDANLTFSAVAERLLQLDYNRTIDLINIDKRCGLDGCYNKTLLLGEHMPPAPTVGYLSVLLNQANIQGDDRDKFLIAIADTEVMKCLEAYLKEKGLIKSSLKDLLDEYWFTEYWRSSKMSSGFQHVFQGEMKHGNVVGLHNWEGLKKKGYPVCFSKEVKLDEKGYVVEMRLQGRNQLKTVFKTVFVETSPELEMALYTLCFSFRTFDKRHDRPNCYFEGRNLYIRTFKRVMGNRVVIESSYPVIRY